MKNIFLTLCFLVTLLIAANAQSDWVTYKIDDKLSVNVPSTPTQGDEYSVIATGADSLLCAIAKIDMKKVSGVDSAALAELAPTDYFKSIVKQGMQEKMKDYTFGDVKTGKWNNYFCYHIEAVNATRKVKSFFFMIIIGDCLYSISAVVHDGKSTQPKDQFFASLKLN